MKKLIVLLPLAIAVIGCGSNDSDMVEVKPGATPANASEGVAPNTPPAAGQAAGGGAAAADQ